MEEKHAFKGKIKHTFFLSAITLLLSMISPAVFAILNAPELSSLGVSLYHTIAPQETEYPIIVLNERGKPENHKDSYSTMNHKVQLDIYCNKGKNGNGGFAEADSIATVVESLLNRYKGTVAGKVIQQIYKSDSKTFYDKVSEAARYMLVFEIRENVAPPKLSNYFVTSEGDNLITSEGNKLIFA